jgi:hypothetical protein
MPDSLLVMKLMTILLLEMKFGMKLMTILMLEMRLGKKRKDITKKKETINSLKLMHLRKNIN